MKEAVSSKKVDLLFLKLKEEELVIVDFKSEDCLLGPHGIPCILYGVKLSDGGEFFAVKYPDYNIFYLSLASKRVENKEYEVVKSVCRFMDLKDYAPSYGNKQNQYLWDANNEAGKHNFLFGQAIQNARKLFRK